MLGQEEGGAVRQVPAEYHSVIRAVLHEAHQLPGVGVGLAAELDEVPGQVLPGGADAGEELRPAGEGVAGAGEGQGRQGIAAGGAEGPAGGGTAAAGAGIGIGGTGSALRRGALRGGGGVLPAEEQVVCREAQGQAERYIFGFEESYGCLIGTYARDKDAIVATMALCEAAAYYKTQGKTLWDAMIEMYEQFGYYKDDIKSVTMKGIEGLQKIQDIMNSLRQNPPAEFAGHKVVAVRDYKADTIKNLETGEVTPTGLPNSNVLYYELTNDAWVCVRPSGTEPKVKFYYGVKGTSLADADEKSAVMGKAVLDMVDSMM